MYGNQNNLEVWQKIWWAARPAVRRWAEESANDTSWAERLQATLRRTMGPPLKSLHEPVDIWLGELPMWVAIACAVGLYAVAVAWVWTLRRDFVFRGAPDRNWWRDLRLWATLLVIPYIAVYLLIGR